MRQPWELAKACNNLKIRMKDGNNCFPPDKEKAKLIAIAQY